LYKLHFVSFIINEHDDDDADDDNDFLSVCYCKYSSILYPVPSFQDHDIFIFSHLRYFTVVKATTVRHECSRAASCFTLITVL